MSNLEQHPAARGMRTALAFVFVWFFVGGIAHFLFVEAQMRIVPPYIPWPRAVVLVSGALEIAGALALLWLPTRKLAAWALALLKQLKRVDFPTFGNPTIPHFKAIDKNSGFLLLQNLQI